MIYLIILSTILVLSGGEVQLRRKAVENGVSFLRIQNYTHMLLPSRLAHKGEMMISLDILMMADYSLYQAFYEITRGDPTSAEANTKEYLTAIFKQIKKIYDDIDIAKQKINLKLVDTFVSFREDDCPMLSELTEDEHIFKGNFTYNTNFTTIDDLNSTDLSLSIPALEALNKLTVFVKKYHGLLRPHDHAILITKFDLISHFGDSATQGMAFVGEICKPGDSSSVVEDIGAAATALIAAHELGHSLGAFHDGTHNTTINCSSSDNYLMAITVSGSENEKLFYNTKHMSNCSLSLIEQRLRKSSASCVWKPKVKDISDKDEILPGEIIPLAKQCQIAFGPHYGACPNTEDYNRKLTICRRMWCKNRHEKRSEPCETRTYLPAFDGTECGAFKWCINGQCVDNTKKLNNCRDLNAKTCSKYSKSKLRHYCKAKSFSDICCSSCSRLKENIL